jgi:hypothetical protein
VPACFLSGTARRHCKKRGRTVVLQVSSQLPRRARQCLALEETSWGAKQALPLRAPDKSHTRTRTCTRTQHTTLHKQERPRTDAHHTQDSTLLRRIRREGVAERCQSGLVSDHLRSCERVRMRLSYVCSNQHRNHTTRKGSHPCVAGRHTDTYTRCKTTHTRIEKRTHPGLQLLPCSRL